MNISEIFIRRPIATSLLMAAIALFGVVAYRALPVSDLPQVDFPTINVSASPAGRRSEHDGVGGREPARASVHDDRRDRLDDLVERHRQQPTSRCSSISTANIDSAAVDVQTAIAAVMPLLPAAHAGAAVVPQEQSGRSADPDPQPDVRRRCRCRRSTTTPRTMVAPRISMVSGVSQVQVQGAAEVRRARAGRSGQAARAGHRPERNRHGAAELERQPADRAALRPDVDLQHQGQRAADERRGVPAASSSPTRTARRSASSRSPTSSTASRTNNGGLVLHEGERQSARSARSSLQVMRQPGTNTIEVTDAVRALLPLVRADAAAVGAPDGPQRSLHEHPRRRSRTSRSRCWSRWCWSSA